MQVKKYLYKLLAKNPLSVFIAEKIIRHNKWQRDLPGHYYSPIASREDFLKNQARLYEFVEEFPGIRSTKTEQLKVYEAVCEFYKTHTLPTGNRFNPANSYFFNGDAMMLFYMLHTLKPKKVIEVGSGHSSALKLDVNEALPASEKIQLTFIEPYTTRLRSLLKKEDYGNVTILEKPVQAIDLSVFKTLNAGDILFIDSSHVSKIGSDVNHILFYILPILQEGVLIHFHDIFYNFEYPSKWIMEGRNWNEDYLLRAFLQYNDSFSIFFFNSFIAHHKKEAINTDVPGFMSDTIGSLWMKKIKA